MAILEDFRRGHWELESYPEYGDFAVLPFFALFFPFVRFFLDRFVFEVTDRIKGHGRLRSLFTVNFHLPGQQLKLSVAGRLYFLFHILGWISLCQNVGKWLIFKKKQQLVNEDSSDTKKKVKKFKESAWKCIYFLSAEILALYVTYDEPWFTKTKYYWVGPGDQVWPDQKIKLKLKGVYMYAAGFYAYSIFALIFWETRRSDFGVSMGHHVATVILIVLSYIWRFARVGSVVLALHDASDIFLEIGKMSKYSGAETLASFAFVLFVLSWIILRLIYYPFWVIWSTSYEVILTLDKEKHPVDGPIAYYVFNSLLICLLVLHVYWWVLIYRMLVKQIQARGQISDDVRSDSEGEDEHED